MKKVSLYATITFLLAFAALQIFLISKTFYVDEGNNIHSTVEGYADIPFHLAMISKFAFSSHFDLADPLFYGGTIHYHFLTNLVRGLLLRVTDAWSFSILAPIYLLAVLNITFLFLIYKKLFAHNGLAILSFLIFFFGAGTAAWPFFHTDLLSPLVTFDAKLPAQNIDFGPVLSMSFIHQQAFFLGFFLFLSFLLLLFKINERSEKRFMILAMVVLALLPFAHAHSFLATAGILVSGILCALVRKDMQSLKRLFILLIAGIILTVPQVYFIMNANSEITTPESFIKFRLGWMTQPGIGAVQFSEGTSRLLTYADFLWQNFGVILPVFAASVACACLYFRRYLREENTTFIWFGFSALSIFLIVQFFQFQPWDYDNNKLLVYFLFFATPFMIWAITNMFAQKKWMQRMVLALFLVFSTLSGISDTMYRIQMQKENLPLIFSSNARILAEYVRSRVSEDGLILTSTHHLNPVASLAGRPVLVGYPGWLWSSGGIDYSQREAEIQKFYKSPNATDPIFKKYPVRYILLDPTVRSMYGTQPGDLQKYFEPVFTAGDYILYRVAL